MKVRSITFSLHCVISSKQDFEIVERHSSLAQMNHVRLANHRDGVKRAPILSKDVLHIQFDGCTEISFQTECNIVLDIHDVNLIVDPAFSSKRFAALNCLLNVQYIYPLGASIYTCRSSKTITVQTPVRGPAVYLLQCIRQIYLFGFDLAILQMVRCMLANTPFSSRLLRYYYSSSTRINLPSPNVQYVYCFWYSSCRIVWYFLSPLGV